jgi:hypothetical protein
VLARECGLEGPPAVELIGRRPFGLPAHLDRMLTDGELTDLGTSAEQVRALILGPSPAGRLLARSAGGLGP